MKNSKVIIVNGISRGGTNILWNLIQSHPAVCGAMRETSRIFAPFQKHELRFVAEAWMRFPLLRMPPLLAIAGQFIDTRLYNFKLQNFGDPFNGFKSEDVPYTREEIADSAVCLKSINKSIYATGLFDRIYGKRLFTIGLVRDGYGICESWIRRGIPAAKTGRRYRQYAQSMIDYSQKNERYELVRFEDILADPFGQMEAIFRFAQLDPPQIERYRLKAKRVMSEDGTYETPFGSLGHKYWLDAEAMRRFLVPNVAENQAQRLSPEDRAAFEHEALPILKHLGYAD